MVEEIVYFVMWKMRRQPYAIEYYPRKEAAIEMAKEAHEPLQYPRERHTLHV
jgi:hypothetical protein